MGILPRHGRTRPARAILGLLILLLFGTPLLQGCGAKPNNAQGAPQGPPPVGIKVGQTAPDFTLTGLDGQEYRLNDLRGKVVMVNFWATWCPPCRAEMPDIESLYQDYKDKGVVILGVDLHEEESLVRNFVTQGGYHWTFVIDSTGSVAADYHVQVIPTSFFIDRNGVIQAVHTGAMTKRAMEGDLAKALGN